MPLELRNQVTRVEIAGERLGRRRQPARRALAVAPGRHPVPATSREEAQPLLAPLYYIERALAPVLARSPRARMPICASAIDSLIKRNVSVLMLADIGTLPPASIKERVAQWVKKGGVLVRFAGPRLEKGGDDLLPRRLRLGRPHAGRRSVLAQRPAACRLCRRQPVRRSARRAPTCWSAARCWPIPPALGPDVKVWARLKDGTPLVTAAKRGDGQLVFFHVTANSDWSNLPLSGLFVEMLRRIASLGQSERRHVTRWRATAADAGTTPAADVLAPLQVLDGFGLLKSPSATTRYLRRQDSRCQAERREPARLLWACRSPARPQPA